MKSSRMPVLACFFSLLMSLTIVFSAHADSPAEKIMKNLGTKIDQRMLEGKASGKLDPADNVSISAFAATFVPELVRGAQSDLKALSPDDSNRVRKFFLGLLVGTDGQLFKEVLAQLPPDQQSGSVVGAAEELGKSKIPVQPWLIELVRSVATNEKSGALVARATIVLLENGDPGQSSALTTEPAQGAAGDKSPTEACRSEMRILGAGLIMLQMDEGSLPANLDLDELCQKKYLRTKPTCPEGGTYEYQMIEGECAGAQCSVHGPGETD